MCNDQTENYPEPLGHFQEGQWWINELDAWAKQPGTTDDQKRAVAVVHHMLRSARAYELAHPKQDLNHTLAALHRALYVDQLSLPAELQLTEEQYWKLVEDYNRGVKDE
ncbi:hypothetical protein [Achromobacter phage Motura]|uniref:Uncharacterized protein n=1 Tax=Achromobacter phage Motura TaxID=2591403 RepID=A0A514CSF9_9CAUD|nr:hypothetical protein H1O15_gp003 [Achromobacter phage Motura]QDH83412.1 hypothetical protein [Achromobacter phage Motura]